MHYAAVKGILSAKNGINLYRGCTHGCIYCDSRSKCYGMTHDFEDVEVKENAIEILERELRRRRRKCMIGCGAMCDPYIPLEDRIRHTENALKLALQYGFGFTLITKSDRAMRDIDLFARINETARCVVQMTVTTADEALCAIVEPNVSGTAARFEALKRLQERGIPTVVWLTPILPFINDDEKNMIEIVDRCAEAGVYGIVNFGAGLTLREGNREYFYAQLDRSFPGLKDRYIRTYGKRYVLAAPDHARWEALFGQRCEHYGIVHDPEAIFAYLNTFEEKGGACQPRLF